MNCSPCCLEAVRVGLPEDQLKVATCARAQSRISSVAASWPVIRARIAFSTGLLGKGGGARRSSAAHLTRFQPQVEWGPASAKHSTLGRIEGEVGRPVAQLGPIEAPAGSHTLADLAAQGRILPARRGDRPPPEMSLPLWAGTRIDQLVREVRGR